MARDQVAILEERIALADQLRAGRRRMLTPQSLPGRYGRVVAALDRVLDATRCSSVVGGGWAVWRHGYVGRVTEGIDIVLPTGRVDEFLRVASVSGFSVLHTAPGRWPKLDHKESNIQVDILPEGQRPGVPPDLAPTTIPSPEALGALGSKLTFMSLAGLVELKIAAGRLKDQADVIELIRANRDELAVVREHLEQVHASYVATFERLIMMADNGG